MQETQSSETSAPARGNRQRDHGEATNSVVIGPRDSLIGKLTVEGEVRIQGLLEGELHATGDVIVEGTANASIEAPVVTVRGQVSGDVDARNRLILAATGVLSGNVKVGRLSVEEGATLNGTVTMIGKRGAHQNRPPGEEPSEKPEGE